MTEQIIGIDLGTTNSLAANVFETGPEILENGEFSSLIPSVVTLRKEKILVGKEALQNRTKYPEETVYSFKRFMGRGAKDIHEDLSKLPFKISIGERDNILVGVAEELQYSPEEISAIILKKIKIEAESILGVPVTKAVITVPAYFDDAQRQATRDAATLAGLEALRIINEPTAAAIAYGLNEKKQGKIAVYDFGGGTFDVSILNLKGKLFKVMSTHGDTHLGGDDIDQLLLKHIIESFEDIRITTKSTFNPETLQILKQAAELIKIELTTSLHSKQEISLPEFNRKHTLQIDREEFDQIILPVVQQTLEHVEKAIKEAKIEVQDIEEVVMVGGSSKIPLVRKMVGDFFNLQPHVNLNPEQVVAIGAAIQGHLLAGGKRDYLLMDIVPLSLGIETLGGTFSKMIMKSASIPAQVTETFSTSADNQTGIELTIYQGEREFVKDCRKLGKFILKGIPPMPAGLPKVDVTFFVDANGMLKVTAKEQRSGTETSIEIIPNHGLKKTEIRQILEDSMEFAFSDFNSRNYVEFKEKTESILKGLDKIWDRADQYITKEQMAAIQEHRKFLELEANKNNPESLKAAIDKMGDLTRDLADSIMGDAAKKSTTY